MKVAVVRACRRDGTGGSPTAVLCHGDAPPDLPSRCRLASRVGASHTVVVSGLASGVVDLRFYTAEGELPACGHGTVAALAFLADRAGVADFEVHLRVGSRILPGRVDGRLAVFEEPRVALRLPTAGELDAVLPALGLWPLTVGVLAASTGRWRLLIPVDSREALAALNPDPFRLRDATERRGLLGCYVYTRPDDTGRAAARMFAPAIGVPEDAANANSTACLAAAIPGRELTVDMGDALGHPSTIVAVARPYGIVEVGGEATVTDYIDLRP
ncbi:PhzF family phenazine biosynthesis protein [Actinoplanes bogorensis]|uniref:PhzF family phenazine biosynthesis protein n=1 Tax=Paractinoplanes bogorensis TaxID=1610840 RepID=A0ABS5YGZ0_9ACTN|nr:PhzF family phenazine biosynthesis protein [Actinoplanes bogorensis]MBU2662657.1 PhzF family phenazine biosynthesis protein [Actinoplanes bogorensis]